MAAEDLTSPDITPPPSGPLGGLSVEALTGPLGIVRTTYEIQRCHAEELSAAQRILFDIDLVCAAKRLLGFLRTINSLPCLHKGPAVLRAIRRYHLNLHFHFFDGQCCREQSSTLSLSLVTILCEILKMGLVFQICLTLQLNQESQPKK